LQFVLTGGTIIPRSNKGVLGGSVCGVAGDPQTAVLQEIHKTADSIVLQTLEAVMFCKVQIF
jgi:hypothetical protein